MITPIGKNKKFEKNAIDIAYEYNDEDIEKELDRMSDMLPIKNNMSIYDQMSAQEFENNSDTAENIIDNLSSINIRDVNIASLYEASKKAFSKFNREDITFSYYPQEIAYDEARDRIASRLIRIALYKDQISFKPLYLKTLCFLALRDIQKGRQEAYQYLIKNLDFTYIKNKEIAMSAAISSYLHKTFPYSLALYIVNEVKTLYSSAIKPKKESLQDDVNSIGF